MLFDQLSAIATAAIAGLGIALLPIFLFENEFKRGALMMSSWIAPGAADPSLEPEPAQTPRRSHSEYE
jgi:DNA-binding transcriptional LysR family regulator